ncbi:NAD(P)H-hydrate dehydratase [Clostridium sp. YIM B02505]|uniref:Bifunctional NAD(P)H-hydrate repair enzyme n=1 Tax=Clostridium yunnanense TaxID=2800325 RepID=A0ABS1ELV3_9CLOT|nr:NAD(P)H-hydrate dehydratase [Clostridium yunnanense]MBK1810310.1 NAD(P)H-hydrate dehydratase [Clostridium yunnanense]
MRVGSSSTLRSIDKYCIEKIGIPSIVLMENAALKVINNLELHKNRKFVIVCGSGNNGGDGLAVARHLKVLGKEIDVFLVNLNDKLSEDCLINYNILKHLGIKVYALNNIEDCSQLRECLVNSDVTIDALFGTGLSRNLSEFYIDTISVINENSEYIVSIDVPSGMNCDNGKVMGSCINANKTITFEFLKKGFLTWGTSSYTGKVIVESIGIPKSVIDDHSENIFMITEELIKKHIPQRDKYGYKGDYGRVLVIAGSMGLSGAAYITVNSAVRSGAGLVTLSTSKELQQILSCKFIEAMTSNYEDEEQLDKHVKKSHCIAVGPGMGDSSNTLELLKKVIYNAECPIVIDADGINVLKGEPDILKDKKCSIVITPHIGEMSNLTGYSKDYIKENRLEVAKEIAEKYKIVVLLKGYNTIITDGNKTYINPTGNSSMASGGMGDCLTGIITSFIAQGINTLEAAAAGAYVHGYIGECLSKSMYCVNASHIIENIPTAIKEMQLK